MKRIVITGGHHNCGLVTALGLRERGYEVIWFGHKYTMAGDKTPGAEFKEVTNEGFKFVEIKAGKVYRSLTLLNLILLPLGFLQSFIYLIYYRPKIILSFGGYLAVPVVICGWILRIPSVTHEQTVVSGLANRAIEFFAKKVFVSWKTSLSHFSDKAVFTGLPLRKNIFDKNKNGFVFPNRLPVVFITGGKQGAHVINDVVAKDLGKILEKCNVIHQCGSNSLFDDYNKMKERQKQLPVNLRQRYLVKDYYLSSEMGHVFAASDLIIGRSGAHITYEIASLGKPAIFIPMPYSSADEQNKNAQTLHEIGLAEILPQEQLTGETLFNLLVKVLNNIDDYLANSAQARELVSLKATEKIVVQVEKII